MTKNKSKGTILIVDDDTENVNVIFNYLRDSGFSILVAENGRKALETVPRVKPDIMLLDITMPDIDGYEVYRRLQENKLTQDMTVIFMSVLSETENIVRGFDLNAVDYITKPFQPLEVVARVEKHLALHSLRKKLEKRNEQLEKEIAERRRTQILLLNVVDNLDTLIYVTDMDTYKVLFANRRVIQVFGDVEGKLCWKVLQDGQIGPCDFCTNPLLVNSAGEPTGPYRWEFENTRNGVTYSIIDSAIRWVDGQWARLSMAVDITMIKMAQDRLIEQEQELASLKERKRLARNLHDSMTQSIQSLSLTAKTAQSMLEKERLQSMPKLLDILVDGTEQAHKELRLLLHELNVVPDEETDLFDILRTRLENVEERVEIKTNLEIEGRWFISKPIEIEIFYIAQEALNNALRHANAEEIRIVIEGTPASVVLMVSDNGQGFESPTNGPADLDSFLPTGMGIPNMVSRANKLGGILEIDSGPDAGTSIRFMLEIQT